MTVTIKACKDLKLDLAAEVLRSRGTVRLRALGTSMLPAIWPGDALSIESQPPEQMVPGDIVLVLRGSRFFVHRLIEKRNGQDGSRWITRGDALPHSDPPATAAELLGKISSIARGSKMIIPERRAALLTRAVAWMLCHRDSLRNVVLHLHSLWQNRVRAGTFFRRVRHRVSGLPTVACARGDQRGKSARC